MLDERVIQLAVDKATKGTAYNRNCLQPYKFMLYNRNCLLPEGRVIQILIMGSFEINGREGGEYAHIEGLQSSHMCNQVNI
jgi:hypothetical protein